MKDRLKFAREFVRVGRKNGWSTHVIVKESGSPCYVLLVAESSFGSLSAARKRSRQLLDLASATAKAKEAL